jgi:hypothetical protein
MATLIKNGQWFDENATDVDFIRAHEDLTPRGKHHMPISSADILTKFREKAKSLGITLANENGALRRDGTRFMYVADIKDESRPDYALSLGFRQASDTTMSFSAMCGTSVFICQNGCCSSLIKPSRMRHTIGNVEKNLIDGRIDIVFNRFLEDKDEIAGQIELMKSTTLTDELVGKFVRMTTGKWNNDKFEKNPLIGPRNLVRILEELENPTINRKDDNSVFRLLNAASFVTTHKMKNPNQSVLASRELNNIIMGLIKSDFTPLGDVIEVETEVVEE